MIAKNFGAKPNSALPNAFCLGAPKCGTTTLYEVLARHPDIYAPEVKEPHFFCSDHNFNRGLDWYAQNYYADSRRFKIRIDFSPSYLSNERALTRIREAYERPPRIIVVLRHPVDRAYSHYLHRKRDGLEHDTFEVALEKDAAKVGAHGAGYIRDGLYGRAISNVIRLFGSEPLHVLSLERDLKVNSAAAIKGLQEFLGVQNVDLPVNIHSNQAAVGTFPALRKLLFSDNQAKRLVKALIAHQPTRDRIRNYLDNRLRSVTNQEPISGALRAALFRRYFADDATLLKNTTQCDWVGLWTGRDERTAS